MERKIMLLLFIKIYALIILLSWAFHFKNDVSIFIKFQYENYNLGKKLEDRRYRTLAKYKQDMYVHNTYLKEDIKNYVSNEKKDVTDIEKKVTTKKEKLNTVSSTTERGHKQYIKNKSCMFETRKYSHMEKKIFKELDYIDFLNNNKTISNKIFRKLVLKKYRVRFVLPLFFVLCLLASIILDFSYGVGLIRGFIELLKHPFVGWLSPLHKALKESPLSFLFESLKGLDRTKKKLEDSGVHKYYVTSFLFYMIYLIPFLILTFTLIFMVVYYHKKVKKYQKIKFRKR
ncbi:fam-l protein [Plasmodium malariae]|uniref:Fam-l protein n=1 Tax=Plasmodium malariae TaxID=5858 RepID=A0A1D3JHG3_PLAMA|nr:fam-l protein [Plasmodium malariae]SBT85673.1 fam-l protein [Plasmodium malariae]